MLVEENSHVQWGRTRIDFGIRRSDRRKTVAVAIDPLLGVVLTAPRDVPIARLNRVVKEKASWIVERLRRVDTLEPTAGEREFVSGESFLYLGRHYQLKVKALVQPRETKLDHGKLVVVVDRNLTGSARTKAAEEQLSDWYRSRAKIKLSERTELWAGRMNLVTTTVLVRRQQKRWGSCDQRGVLRMNWRIIQAPMRLVDYVVAHELTHLTHKDHTKAFWARLGQVMPEYEARKEELRRIGTRLEW